VTIDMTTSLMPLIWALEASLVISAAAIVGSVLSSRLRRRRRRVLRPAVSAGSTPALSGAVGR
jgi:hypothetical protein